ncbi:hypothetical protein A2856_02020 [Candidatus Uhrbacteria bacterium RIFCSPHIGHO2_01_FULL_63_20]|uniref:Probable cytosol aminopeptidase n=1 Tax=Candidatus Uhrbacteria bacterium RIFCSPHIGHO2_01_FULL_63_20 TaxID=1802385 RepID=A0A1F7TLM8_9BACT|nr:MAG: hypothetical protein A2856_02020 [Candidatus Uhrbacteria bacterium RIFCSPHIGHO2_01_FULL_63_20]
MEILLKKGVLGEEKADAVVMGHFAGGKANSPLIEREIKDHAFTGKLGSTVSIRAEAAMKARRVILVGLGQPKAFTEESAREAAACAVNAARNVGAKRVAVEVMAHANVSAKTVAKAMVEGMRLAAYEYRSYKTDKADGRGVKVVTILALNARDLKSATDGAALGELYAAATMKARDLVNTPSAHMAPKDLLVAAQEAVRGHKGVRIRSYDKAALERLGAGGILGIAQGSDHEPVMVHMRYRPANARKSIALVGKAVTFDSGGLSLKPANSMETMKLDMAGAAAVIGAFSAIARLHPRVEVHGIFGACENMPSGKAIRPGDVVRTLSGKTIEIRNTDAEGRVTLADTLAYAAKLKPDLIVDVATLTGACVIALGEEITGLMSNDHAAALKVGAAAVAAGESVWELPLEKRYRPLIESDIADFKNDAPRWGGALTAGLLLQEFVNGIPWVHLDIAGPAFAERPLNAYTKKGATGHGTRTLLELIRMA